MDFRTAFLLVIWSGLSLLTVVKSAENLALSKPTNQSSTFTTYDSSKAVDGCARQQHLSDCCIHTDYQKGYTEVWWQVDLQQQSVLEYVSIIYRDEIDLQPQRLAGFELYLSNTSDWTSGMRCYKDNTPTESSMALFLSISCQNVARYVTIYNDRRIKTYPWYSDDAVLELCEVSVYGCTIGKYGNGNCNNDCLNCLGDKCHPTSGVCDVCDIGYYKNGANCILCPLGCVGNYCDRNSGYCLDCRDGYYGPLCSPCSTGCNRDTCNKTSGVCFQCDPGRYGDKCEQTCTPYCRDDLCIQSNGVCIGCKPGYYGDMCDYPCPANCRDFACLQANGKCDECIPGYYGERCDQACPQNCRDSLCDRADGRCSGCQINFYGFNCTKNCPNNCKDRPCMQDTGGCSECISGFYGNECLGICGHCQDASCDKDTGNCLTPCTGGLTGDKCDIRVVYAPREDDDSLNIPAIGIGVGSGVVILALVIALIVQARRHQLRNQQDTTKPTKDIHLSDIGQGPKQDTDGTYEAIDAIRSEPSRVGTSIEVNNYECLRSAQREAPHLYDTA